MITTMPKDVINSPKQNKIGMEVYVHWILYNYKKFNNAEFKIVDTKITRNIAKIVDFGSAQQIYYENNKKSNYYLSFFRQVEEFEKFSDVISNSIIYRIFNTIKAQENIGFVRESRFSVKRLENKIKSLDSKGFIFEFNGNFEEESIKIILLLDFIYSNKIHLRLISLNESINDKTEENTIKLLKEIPNISDDQIILIMLDLSNLNGYHLNKNNFINISSEFKSQISELFNDFNNLDEQQLLYWIYDNDDFFCKYGYDINELLESKMSIHDIKDNIEFVSKIIPKMYGKKSSSSGGTNSSGLEHMNESYRSKYSSFDFDM